MVALVEASLYVSSDVNTLRSNPGEDYCVLDCIAYNCLYILYYKATHDLYLHESIHKVGNIIQYGIIVLWENVVGGGTTSHPTDR